MLLSLSLTTPKTILIVTKAISLGIIGKKAILIDDILNTGRTFSEAAKIVEREGATEIYAVSSHGYLLKVQRAFLAKTSKEVRDRLT